MACGSRPATSTPTIRSGFAKTRKRPEALVTDLGGADSADDIARLSPDTSGVMCSSKVVLAFLDRYQVHEKAPDNDTGLIARYVRNRNDRGRLDGWNVALIGSSTASRGQFNFGGGVEVPR